MPPITVDTVCNSALPLRAGPLPMPVPLPVLVRSNGGSYNTVLYSWLSVSNLAVWTFSELYVHEPYSLGYSTEYLGPTLEVDECRHVVF